MPAKVKVTVVEGSKWPLNMRVLSSYEPKYATVALTRLEARKLANLLVDALVDGMEGEVDCPDGTHALACIHIWPRREII